MIGARGDRFVIAGAGAREVAVVEIEQAEFFVVPGGRIVENGALEFVDAAAAWKRLKRGAKQAGIGDDLCGNVDESSEPSADEDDEQPVSIWATANEVHDGNRLQYESPPGSEEER